MFNHSDRKAEINFLSKFARLFKVYAEETDAEETVEEKTEDKEVNTINFETLIANARKEEKDKLYPRIKKLEEENKTLVQTNNETLLKLAAAMKEIDELKAKLNSGEENPKIKDLEEKIKTLETENAALKENTPKEEEIRKKIEEEYEVKLYRTEKLNEVKDEILSIFVDDVQGKTKEEIDSAIAKAKEKTAEVKKQLGIVSEKKEEKPKKPPVANPNTTSPETLDIDYIRNLDPRSKEYLEFRKKMGLK